MVHKSITQGCKLSNNLFIDKVLKTKVVVIDTDQIKGLLNKSLITSPATPRKIRAATRAEKGIIQANQTKHGTHGSRQKEKAKASQKVSPKVRFSHAILFVNIPSKERLVCHLKNRPSFFLENSLSFSSREQLNAVHVSLQL